MAEPKIYSKNYVNSDDLFTFSHGQATKNYLFDRDNGTQYATSGGNSDATTVSIIVDFLEGTVAQSRTIDTFILLNHNLKNYTLYSWNGTTWVSQVAITNDSTANRIASFSAVTTSKIKLEATSTQTANQEKKIGELVICALRLDIGQDIENYEIRYRQKSKDLVMSDGSMHQMVTRHSVNRIQKYEARVLLQYIAQATYDALLAIKESGEPFLWHPETSQRPDQLFYVHWASTWTARYASFYKAAGYEISFDLREV